MTLNAYYFWDMSYKMGKSVNWEMKDAKMLGKLRFTQNLEILTWPNDILGKGYIFSWLCACLGTPILFLDFRLSIVFANYLFYNRCRLFYDLKNVSLFPVCKYS